MRGSMQIPFLSIGFGMLAILFIVLSFTASWQAFAPLVIGAVAAAFLCWPWNAADQAYDLAEEGLVHAATGELLHWDSLDYVFCSGRCPDPALVGKGRIVAWFGDRKVALKTPDGMTTGKLYEQLWDIALNNRQSTLQVDSMRTHFQNEVDTHGTNDVTSSTSGAPKRDLVRVPGKLFWATLVFLIAGVASAIVGQGHPAGFIVAGLAPVVFMVLALLWLVDKSKSKAKNSKTNELVISPAGLALHTDTLKGKMSWSELTSIAFTQSATKPTQINIKVVGADIVLPDVFLHPAWYLYREMQRLRKLAVPLSPQESSPIDPPIDPPVDTGNPYQPPNIL